MEEKISEIVYDNIFLIIYITDKLSTYITYKIDVV